VAEERVVVVFHGAIADLVAEEQDSLLKDG
jgi:hypothetical protein